MEAALLLTLFNLFYTQTTLIRLGKIDFVTPFWEKMAGKKI
jgi:hypothetical protein